MDAGEFVQLWHASFGPEAQPPESCSNLGERLTVQDVGTELRACETRVESLRTELKRELRALEWLRRIVADLERRASDGGDSGRRPSEGEQRSPRLRAASASHPPRTREKSGHSEPDSPSYPRQSTSLPTSPRRPARHDIVFSTSVEVSVKSKDPGHDPPCDSLDTERPATDAKEDQRSVGASEEGNKRGSVVRERTQSQTNDSDKSVARAVSKRLIERGKWWSSNLLTLERPPQALTPPINRRRAVSDPPDDSKRGRHRRVTAPSIKVHEVIKNFEKLSQETAPKVNPAVDREKEVSHVRRHTSLETVNEGEKPSGGGKKVEATETAGQESSSIDRLGDLPVRQRPPEKQKGDKFVFPGYKNHVVYSTHSLNRRNVRTRISQFEQEGPTSSTLKRQQLPIEAKLADRRRTGGWKVVEVGGPKQLSKTPSLQQINIGSRSVSEDRVARQKEQSNTAHTRATTPHRSVPLTHTAPRGPVSEVARVKRVASPVATQPRNMFKAAKEKLSRVTSSPPLRRRPSRGSRGREGPQHRSSNGQVEQTSVSPSPVPPSGGSGVQEVMVEKRVERSESLLSEIMSHRFSNGMEGSQLLESGEHSLISSQEMGGSGGGESTNVSKVILRRRSERDNDPLPEAKRRSSCLEEDDCSTPKEDFSLSLADDSLTQGLTKSMVDATSVKRSQVQRMTSDSTLRQDSLEATLTPASLTSGGSSSPGNVNYRMSYMTAVHDSPQMEYTTPGGLRDSNQVDYMPLINETEGEMTNRLALVASEPNLLDLDQVHMLEKMELDEATISAVTLNNDLFGSRSGSVTSLPDTLNDSQSTSTASLTEPFLSPAHTPAPVVNLRPSSGSGGGGRRRNRRREGNAELDDQTGASLVEMLSSERLRSPNTTASSSQFSTASSGLSPTTEEVASMSDSPTTPTLFPTPLHGTHLKEVEVRFSLSLL